MTYELVGFKLDSHFSTYPKVQVILFFFFLLIAKIGSDVLQLVSIDYKTNWATVFRVTLMDLELDRLTAARAVFIIPLCHWFETNQTVSPHNTAPPCAQ